jgi:hypothetical protein
LGALSDLGPVSVFQGGRDVIGLSPPRFEDGTIQVDVQRHMAPAPRELTIVAHGLDPAGIPRDLARQTVALDTGDTAGTAVFDLPPELRNRITRFEVAGVRSAGAVTLTDDALQRREVALIDAQGEDEGQALLSPLHYLRQALAPTADLMEGRAFGHAAGQSRRPDPCGYRDPVAGRGTALIDWVERGGLLVRFAGPRLAASDVARDAAGPLMPVRLRSGAARWAVPCPGASQRR